MNKLLTYCLPLAFAIFAVGCGPDDTPDPEQKNGSTICDYAPYSTGSVFSFESNGQQLAANYDVVVKGDTMMDGETWKIIQNEPGGRSYFNCRNNQLVSRAYNASPTLLVNPFDFIPLKFNAPVGTEWVQEYPSRDGTIRYIHEITEINGTRTVNGMDFEGVITVNQITQLDVVFFGDTITQNADISNYWYAPDAGLIESEVGGGVRLTSFDVN